jgi:hypothetical protein
MKFIQRLLGNTVVEPAPFTPQKAPEPPFRNTPPEAAAVSIPVIARVIQADAPTRGPLPCEEICIGEFVEVFTRGVSIGSGPNCSVKLRGANIMPLEAMVFGMTIHKLLFRLPAESQLPASYSEAIKICKPEVVNYQPFRIGPYIIQIEPARTSTPYSGACLASSLSIIVGTDSASAGEGAGSTSATARAAPA